ncbi:MAG: hypothetical protein E6H58_16970 [Betaproteobacteria bacterium]|nr:MAG: hypothetical protein E6H65_12220 [Betaproteobacteria bacterium]TMH28937.1 MAG: hypothetical protein E6H58_16970 [Betaproteobacteria bacterium]
MQQPAKYLVVIDSGGEMIARMFDASRKLLVDFDASSSEVAVMTQGLVAQRSAIDPAWDKALRGHSAVERSQAEVYTLDV